MEDSMTVSNGKYELSISRDEFAANPRTEWDNLGKMVCWHRRYNLGDEHEFESPSDFEESAEYQKAFVILPLYLYDHSGITISTRDFGDRWDSGQVGYIYVTEEQVKNFLNVEPNENNKDLVREQLLEETRIYDCYLQGDCYRFTISDMDGNEVDSCGGFYGDKMTEIVEEMKGNVSEEHEGLFKQVERHSKAFAAMM